MAFCCLYMLCRTEYLMTDDSNVHKIVLIEWT